MYIDEAAVLFTDADGAKGFADAVSGLSALMAELSELRPVKALNVLSLGCGACAELAAMESFCKKNRMRAHYIGVDNTPENAPFRDAAKRSFEKHKFITADFADFDPAKHLRKNIFPGFNLLILGNLPALKAAEKPAELATYLADNVVRHRARPLAILLYGEQAEGFSEYLENSLSKRKYLLRAAPCAAVGSEKFFAMSVK